MSDPETVYNNVERKRELVESLKNLQGFYLAASDALDKKAWDILRVTTATFGIVSAIQINLVSDNTPGLFWAGLLGVLILYSLQVREVLATIRPTSWALVPGVEDNDFRYETLVDKYVATAGEHISEDDYLNQLIADYIGCIDVHDNTTIRHGSIQKIEKNNKIKAQHVNQAAKLLGGIIAALILLGFAASV